MNFIHLLYLKLIKPWFPDELVQQRVKLIWFIWGYMPLFLIKIFPFKERLKIIASFIRIDWYILHGHRPCEISSIVKVLSERKAKLGEIMIEAGCWLGGSTSKFSIVCKILGYKLYVFDSFQGVEQLTLEEKEKSFDFSGAYSASKDTVVNNINKYGEIEVCSFFEGWFSNTLAKNTLNVPVRVVYIDCDTAKGTHEVLKGTTSNLVDDGTIFSQDYHINTVKEILHSALLWKELNRKVPAIYPLCHNLAQINFNL